MSQAVSRLKRDTAEARQELFERARTILIEQLRKREPPATEAEIMRERFALEDAIRKIEADVSGDSALSRSAPNRRVQIIIAMSMVAVSAVWPLVRTFNPDPRDAQAILQIIAHPWASALGSLTPSIICAPVAYWFAGHVLRWIAHRSQYGNRWDFRSISFKLSATFAAALAVGFLLLFGATSYITTYAGMVVRSVVAQLDLPHQSRRVDNPPAQFDDGNDGAYVGIAHAPPSDPRPPSAGQPGGAAPSAEQNIGFFDRFPADDKKERFLEVQNDILVYIVDLDSVQIILPGKFSFVETTIDPPHMMKFELQTVEMLRQFCGRSDGEYAIPKNFAPPSEFLAQKNKSISIWWRGCTVLEVQTRLERTYDCPFLQNEHSTRSLQERAGVVFS